jgi:hypothetical protein
VVVVQSLREFVVEGVRDRGRAGADEFLPVFGVGFPEVLKGSLRDVADEHFAVGIDAVA